MTSLSSFTQTNYPKILIIDGDTIVGQTIDQTRYVSIELEKGKSCALASSIKDSIISVYKQKDSLFTQTIKIKDSMISDRDSTIADKDIIINKQDEMYTDLKKENKSLQTKNTLMLVLVGIMSILPIFY